MQTFFALILNFLMLFSALFVPFSCAPTPDAEDDFVPVLRFVATSDTHINALGDKGCRRVAAMINSAYSIAEADPDYKELDAVVFSGDITDNGTFTAFSAFAATTDKAIRGDTERLAVVAKAHDGGTYDSDSLEIFTSLTGQETDFHRVIDGFHFIGVSRSPEAGVHYTDEQVQWLDRELAAATAAAPSQPVFVFQHEHVLDTVFGSYSYDGWGMDTFKAVLEKYPQAVHISGHSHYPANDPRSIWQGSFTAIGDVGLAYYEFTVDDETSVHPDGNKSMTQALLVEVDARNRVLVRVLDVDAGEFTAQYLIDNITDPVKTKYDHNIRRAVSVAPAFPDGAFLTCEKKLGGYKVSFPAAVVSGSDNAVYLYRLTVTDENGNTVKSAWQLSDYYYAKHCNTASFDKFTLLPDGDYTVSVTAEDVWGNRSAPLTLGFSS